MNIDQILNFRRGLTFNSYSRLILDPLRRPDKLLLLLQRTLRVSPGNHTFGLSSFLPLLFILKSVMAPPLQQVEFKKGFPIQEFRKDLPKHLPYWHSRNISRLSSPLLKASSQKAPAQGPPHHRPKMCFSLKTGHARDIISTTISSLPLPPSSLGTSWWPWASPSPHTPGTFDKDGC